MMTNLDNGSEDEQIRQILDVLEPYKADHANARIDVRRQNSVSIRIRIVDPEFSGMDRIDREPPVWRLLKTLPQEIFADITMLLLLTPGETSASLANQEFDAPIPSRL